MHDSFNIFLKLSLFNLLRAVLGSARLLKNVEFVPSRKEFRNKVLDIDSNHLAYFFDVYFEQYICKLSLKFRSQWNIV